MGAKNWVMKKIHAITGSAGTVTANPAYDEIVAEGSGATGMSILCPDGSLGSFAFGTDSDSVGAFMQWDYANNRWIIGTARNSGAVRIVTGNNVAAVDIDASGKVAIVGDLDFSTAGGGLSFGGISVKDNSSATTLTTTKVQIDDFDTNGVSNGQVTPDHTNNHLTVSEDGIYEVFASISCANDSAFKQELHVEVWKNDGTTFLGPHDHRTLSGGSGDTGFLMPSGQVSVLADDTLELWAFSDQVDKDVIFEDIRFFIKKIGC